jgi:hypothetical protein
MLERASGLRFTVRTACLAFVLAACVAQAQMKSGAAPLAEVDSLKTFLQSYLRSLNPDFDKTTRYSATFVDLSGEGKKEVIVYASGRGLCGTGGCRTLILARKGSSYRVVTHITITRPPIRVSKNTSHGWRNISVWVGGRGINPGYEAELRFDGTTYPSNPTVPPARPLSAGATGEVVLSGSEEGTLLYP